MKNILILSTGFLLCGLGLPDGFSQTLRENTEPATSAVSAHPDQMVQPVPKPDRRDAQAPPPPEPLYLNSGNNPPPDVTRPLEPLPQPSIDRLYQNRMEVDNYSPAEMPTQPLAPPPGNMQPQNAPNRPGTVGGTGNQGNAGRR